MIKIYHNPRCRKSRETLQLLQEKNLDFEIVEYLKTIPSKDELEKLLHKLNVQVDAIIRKEEQIYKEKFKGKNFTDSEWLQILTEYPKLIQRPIVVKNNKAIIGRPPENVNTLF